MAPPTTASRLLSRRFREVEKLYAIQNQINYIYELTPRGIRAKAALTVSFLDRKRHEYEDLKLEIERLESELGVEDMNKPGATGDPA